MKLAVSRFDGLIARIALVLERRGFFLESLKITKCSDDFSCLYLSVEGSEDRFIQVCKQLEKLVDIIKLEVLPVSVPEKSEVFVI